MSIFEDDLFDIYNSRTFCLYEDIEKLKKMQLGKGGSLENAIVVKDDEILNELIIDHFNYYFREVICKYSSKELYLSGSVAYFFEDESASFSSRALG